MNQIDPRTVPNRCRCSFRNRYDCNREEEGGCTSWKPEVPFMAGSVESSVRENSHAAHLHCYVQATGSPY